MDMLTIYKINRIVTAKRLGVPPSYFDEAGDAPDFGDLDIRRYEIADCINVMNAAVNVQQAHNIKVFF